MLQVENITKKFAGVTALKEVTFRLPEHSFTALVGDNGSGKSTLVNLITGNLKADKGRITWQGENLLAMTIKERQRLGIRTVYQDLALDPCKNSCENIFLGAESKLKKFPLFLDRSTMQKQADKLLAELGVNIPDLTLPVRFLSGGQRQGIALARAISRGCELLILDEPFAAMGLRESQKFLARLRALHSQGITILLITHNPLAIYQEVDQLLILRAGELRATVDTSRVPFAEFEDLYASEI